MNLLCFIKVSGTRSVLQNCSEKKEIIDTAMVVLLPAWSLLSSSFFSWLRIIVTQKYHEATMKLKLMIKAIRRSLLVIVRSWVRLSMVQKPNPNHRKRYQ